MQEENQKCEWVGDRVAGGQAEAHQDKRSDVKEGLTSVNMREMERRMVPCQGGSHWCKHQGDEEKKEAVLKRISLV